MALLLIFSFIILIFSVVIHEVSHGVAALWQGDPTAKLAGRLTLNPLKHVDPIGSVVVPIICMLLPGNLMLGWAKPVPFNPYNLKNKRFGEAIVAIAGPLSNIVIATILGLILRFYGVGLLEHTQTLLVMAVYTNIALAVFNMVPLPPLDGSKVLYALFPMKTAELFRKIESYGFILTLIFIFAFVEIINPVISFIFKVIVG
jgi:Zn-dependent protease